MFLINDLISALINQSFSDMSDLNLDFLDANITVVPSTAKSLILLDFKSQQYIELNFIFYTKTNYHCRLYLELFPALWLGAASGV